jgi:hypothetical protein
MTSKKIIEEMEQHRATVHFHKEGAFAGQQIADTLNALLSADPNTLENSLTNEHGAFHFKSWPLVDLAQAKEVLSAVQLTTTKEDEHLFESGKVVHVCAYRLQKEYGQAAKG